MMSFQYHQLIFVVNWLNILLNRFWVNWEISQTYNSSCHVNNWAHNEQQTFIQHQNDRRVHKQNLGRYELLPRYCFSLTPLIEPKRVPTPHSQDGSISSQTVSSESGSCSSKSDSWSSESSSCTLLTGVLVGSCTDEFKLAEFMSLS